MGDTDPEELIVVSEDNCEDSENSETEYCEVDNCDEDNCEEENCEEENGEAENGEAENGEAENVEAENVEAENVEAENVEAENVEAEKVKAETVQAENSETSSRVTNSLGALLSGLSSKAASAPKKKEGFDLENMEEISDWRQLGKMDEQDDNTRGGSSKKRDASGDREGSGKRGRQDYKADVYGPKDVTDWNDLKMYDDDHDEQYFRDEEAVLAEKYGGDFIKLKYITEGKIGYYCEICHAEMNAKKSLELHCSGMKHLKKKDIWEKNGRKIIPGTGVTANNNPPAQPPEEKEWRGNRSRKNDDYSSSSDWRGNRKSGRDEGSWNNSRNVPPAPSFRNDDYSHGSYRDRDRDRDRDFEGRKYYGRQDQGRDPYGGRDDDYDRDSYYDRPRVLGDYFRDGYRDGDLRDRYMDRRDMDRRDDPYYDRWGDSRDDDRPDYGRYSPKREPYPGCRRPPPPPAPSKEDKLSSGPTGSLLQKLGDCCVKSTDDAELAMNVVSNLSLSLKDFYSIRGEAKVADLLGDVELKLKTIKALKVGLKVLGEASFLGDESSSSAPAPVPAPAPPGGSSMFRNSAGFSASQPVRYPVAGLYRPPVQY